jgi:hypothetical protein
VLTYQMAPSVLNPTPAIHEMASTLGAIVRQDHNPPLRDLLG